MRIYVLTSMCDYKPTQPHIQTVVVESEQTNFH